MGDTARPEGPDEQAHWNTGLQARRGMPFRERIRAEDAYGILLVLIILSLVAIAVIGNTSMGGVLVVTIECGILLFALYTSRSGRGALRTALVLVPIVVVVAAVLSGGATDLGAGVVATTSAVLCLVASAAIVRRLGSHPRVDGVTILGALSTYLLIGSFFASVFLAINAFAHQPFFVTQGDVSTVDFYYFSYVTLATVGYGDLTARADLGRMLAVTEALLGQLYLVSVVALVIGNVGRERRSR
jgi:hypothetical protein